MKYSNLRVKQDTSLFLGLDYIGCLQDSILDVFKSNDKLIKKHEVKEKKIIDFVFKSIRVVQIQNYESSISKNFKVFSFSRVFQKNNLILNYFYVENNDKSNDSQCEQIICIVSHKELIKSFIVLSYYTDVMGYGDHTFCKIMPDNVFRIIKSPPRDIIISENERKKHFEHCFLDVKITSSGRLKKN